MVRTFRVQKAVVGTLLDDLPSPDDQNLVGITNSRKTMGDDDTRPVLGSLVERCLHGSFTSRIQGTVEEERSVPVVSVIPVGLIPTSWLEREQRVRNRREYHRAIAARSPSSKRRIGGSETAKGDTNQIQNDKTRYQSQPYQ